MARAGELELGQAVAVVEGLLEEALLDATLQELGVSQEAAMTIACWLQEEGWLQVQGKGYSYAVLSENAGAKQDEQDEAEGGILWEGRKNGGKVELKGKERERKLKRVAEWEREGRGKAEMAGMGILAALRVERGAADGKRMGAGAARRMHEGGEEAAAAAAAAYDWLAALAAASPSSAALPPLAAYFAAGVLPPSLPRPSSLLQSDPSLSSFSSSLVSSCVSSLHASSGIRVARILYGLAAGPDDPLRASPHFAKGRHLLYNAVVALANSYVLRARGAKSNPRNE